MSLQPYLSLVLLVVVSALAVYGTLAVLIEPLRLYILAHPNHRSSHSNPTPQGAGIAIVPVALVAASIAVAVGAAPPVAGWAHAVAVAAGALGLMTVGLIDDLRTLPIVLRLSVQVVAAVLVVGTLPGEMRLLPEFVPLVLERGLIVLALLWFINLMNFMDGIDGISAVETMSITGGIVALAFLNLVPGLLGWSAAALFGAMAGFAPWNRHPARLFLGDAGSLPIGLLLATLLLHVALAGALAAALILPMYYLADATLTLMRRALHGETVWEAHREHYYQRALRGGLPVPKITGYLLRLNLGLIALAIGATLVGGVPAKLVSLAAACAFVLLVLHRLVGDRPQIAP
jgi:UDP-N-acetylmuramyl pentapeptide phosphotransferase/UDP-N-acetylglucosamine-1-phosphate transferase